LSKSRHRSRKKRRSSGSPSKRSILTSLERFRVGAGHLCDGCKAPASFHAPMWAEPDPYLISFWATLCEPCILERDRVFEALRVIRERGWARPGPPLRDDELPPPTPRPRRWG
jgi:hypothetical protein